LKNAVNLDTTNPFCKLGSSRAKRLMNEFATSKMTVTRIAAIDTDNEIDNWLRQIANRLT
jgi:hypothetical protein